MPKKLNINQTCELRFYLRLKDVISYEGTSNILATNSMLLVYSRYIPTGEWSLLIEKVFEEKYIVWSAFETLFILDFNVCIKLTFQSIVCPFNKRLFTQNNFMLIQIMIKLYFWWHSIRLIAFDFYIGQDLEIFFIGFCRF